MQWRNQRTLAAYLAIALVAIALPHGTAALRGRPRVNIEHTRSIPPKFVTNVNRAASPELSLLPGIGPALAQRIIDSRNHEGPFEKSEDLLRVRGIGPKTLARLKPYLIWD